MKKNNSLRALLVSLLSLLVCFSMLVGSTFAWFTDKEVTGVNTIVAGNLDIKLSYKNSKVTTFTGVSEATTDLFVGEDGLEMLWEPGAVAVCYFKLENLGTLALQYKMAVNYADTVTYGDVKLSDALESAIVPLDSDTTFANRNAALEAAEGKTKALGYQSEATKMASPETKYFAIVIWMPTTIDNTYNLPSDAEALKIELGINLVATQVMSEDDSFNNEYDENATFPEFVASQYVPGTATQFTGDNVTANVPADATLTEEGTGAPVAANTPLTLSVEEAAANSNITITDTQTAKTYEVALKTNDGTKVVSDKPIDVTINIGANRTGLIQLYHYEQPVDSTYDKATGILSFTATGFSPFTVVEDTSYDLSWYNTADSEYVLTTAKQLTTLASLVNNGNDFAGKTVKLGANIDLAGIDWVPIGNGQTYAGDPLAEGTAVYAGGFDGQGYTISNLTVKSDGNNVGLFGLVRIDKAMNFTNVKFDKANVVGTNSNCVGVLAGALGVTNPQWASGGYNTDNVTAITVTNSNVEGNKYAGGVVGYVQSDMTDITVTGTTVVAQYSESFTNGWGDSGENAGAVTGNLYDNYNIKNASVTECTVSGLDKVGGVAGSSRHSNTISQCAVSDLTVEMYTVGGSSGTHYGLITGRVNDANAYNNRYHDNTASGTGTLDGTEITVPEFAVA